jgi:AcrR family transcriptional regulator
MEPTKTDRILEAAFRLLRQHGYRKVTMSDIAEAAKLSRPTLYAEFPNKEAVLAGLVARHNDESAAKTAVALPGAKTLAAQLAVIFDLWIVEPFASVADTADGLDLLTNIGTYVPEATNAVYARLERQLVEVLEPAMKAGGGKRPTMSARDLAHILALATRGLKASTATVVELRRMIDGLIAMTVATVKAHP